MGIQQIGDLPRVKRWGLNGQQKKRFDYENYVGKQQEIRLIKKKMMGVGQMRDLKSYENRFAGKKKSQRMNNKTKQ